MAFFATESLGPSRKVTPEGFLVCLGVPIGRTGSMTYGPGETPLSQDRPVHVSRDSEELFSRETLASFEGKPVTLGHPSDGVNPDNWAQLAVGHIQNVRRGEGENEDKLVADVVLTDKRAIDAVNGDELREVSCGYAADFEALDNDAGRQTRIRGNHLALVPEGRAGPECRIGDAKETVNMAKDGKEVATMNIDEKLADICSRLAKLEESDAKRCAADACAANAKKEMDAKGAAKEELRSAQEIEQEAQHLAQPQISPTTPIDSKDAVEVEIETPSEEPDGEVVGDIAWRGEILVPGFSPVADAKPSAQMRLALAAATVLESGRERLRPVLRGRSVDSLKGAALVDVFIAASELYRAHNSKVVVSDAEALESAKGKQGELDLTQAQEHQAYWAAKRASAKEIV